MNGTESHWSEGSNSDMKTHGSLVRSLSVSAGISKPVGSQAQEFTKPFVVDVASSMRILLPRGTMGAMKQKTQNEIPKLRIKSKRHHGCVFRSFHRFFNWAEYQGKTSLRGLPTKRVY